MISVGMAGRKITGMDTLARLRKMVVDRSAITIKDQELNSLRVETCLRRAAWLIPYCLTSCLNSTHDCLVMLFLQ